jgi:tripartite-type tricarboxylate transporter receptor subunit TctC
MLSVAAIADTVVRSRVTDVGAARIGSTPKELDRYISAEVVKWRAIIAKDGIALD